MDPHCTGEADANAVVINRTFGGCETFDACETIGGQIRKRPTTKRVCVEARKLLSSDWALEQEMGRASGATGYR